MKRRMSSLQPIKFGRRWQVDLGEVCVSGMIEPPPGFAPICVTLRRAAVFGYAEHALSVGLSDEEWDSLVEQVTTLRREARAPKEEFNKEDRDVPETD